MHELSCAHTLLHAHVFDPHAGALGHVIVANTHVERVDTSPLPLRVQLRKDDAVVRVHLRASGHVSIKATGERTCVRLSKPPASRSTTVARTALLVIQDFDASALGV